MYNDLFKDIDCAIFDLDGTLIDSIESWRQVDIKFMEKRGLPIPENFYEKVATMNFSQAADYVIAECGVTDTKDVIMDEWLTMLEYEYSHVIEMIPGSCEFLKSLHESGVKIALATASRPELYIPCLIRHGVYDYFEVFVTTADVKRKKGFPDVYLFAAQKVGAEPERCAVFEDILLGCIGAKAAGMVCVGILEEHSKNEWDEMTSLCDKVISDYKELL